MLKVFSRKLDWVGPCVIEILSLQKVRRFGELVGLNPITIRRPKPLHFIDREQDWNGARSLGPAIRGVQESAIRGGKLDCEALLGSGELVEGSARKSGPFGGLNGRRVLLEKGSPRFGRHRLFRCS